MSEEKQVRGRFKKGASGNPGGRPKRGEAFAEQVRVRWKTGRLLDRLVAIAEGKGTDKPDVRAQLQALQVLASYGFGTPVKSIEIAAIYRTS